MKKFMKNTASTLIALGMFAIGSSANLSADDTEIYQASYTPGEAGSRPNVLIIFDNSGSMDSEPGYPNGVDPRPGELSKLAIAQDVVKKLIADNPDVDFGLALFNTNNDGDAAGGRIVNRIFESKSTDEDKRDEETTDYRDKLILRVDGITSDLWTPLCETSYEAYRYLSGQTVVYGHKKHKGTLNFDKKAEKDHDDGDHTYISPATDCAFTYIILMTDGLPTRDVGANSEIRKLIGENDDYKCKRYPDEKGNRNCLPELAKYMATTDLDDNTANGKQLGIMYTIGFDTEDGRGFLQDVATAGGGTSYVADNADELADAFQGALTSILETEATFTSPSAAVNSFNRTQSRDDVFFSMFEPKETVDWPGNIKKLKIDVSESPARLEDEKGAAAIESGSGVIVEDAFTWWNATGVADGSDVEAGGVGALLAALDATGPTGLDSRKIKTNSGIGGLLEDFFASSLDAEAYGFDVTDPNDPEAALFDLFEVTDQTQLETVIGWGRGYEVDSGLTTADGTRAWILGDMLHSQPLIVNYGDTNSSNEEGGADLRIVVGTNSGFLHMFNNKDGKENWAFFPKRLAPVLTKRARNAISGNHVYGVDASPVLYTKDVNHDGTIKAADNDVAWVYFGLRRGGRALYALDISNPNTPAFKWKITGDPDDNDYDNSDDFAELGYTWSDPVVTKIPGYYVQDSNPRQYKPVLIFGAGYDTKKDAHGLPTQADSMGRGVFIVDANDGSLVWSVTPGSNSAKNLSEAGLVDSVPASVTALDSNGDELTDRIYFGDTGGNLWRVDMPGDSLPTSSQNTWRIVQLADVNGGTVATDRRFFNAPDVVRTREGAAQFDAVLIGTGDRTNPNGTDVANQFYMIKDKQVNPYFTAEPSNCPADPYDFRCSLPLEPTVSAPDPNDPNPTPYLYNVTDNLIQIGTEEQQATAQLLLTKANGWQLDLNQAAGEKSLSRSLTIQGKTYFGTFSPNLTASNECSPSPGTGYFYVINLLNASAEYNFDGEINTTERAWIIGSLIPDTPSVHVDSDGIIRLLLPPGSGGGGEMSNPFMTGASLPDPYGSYWYREEY